MRALLLEHAKTEETSYGRVPDAARVAVRRIKDA